MHARTHRQRLYTAITNAMVSSLLILLMLVGFLFTTHTAHATVTTYPAASWWSGQNCDESFYESNDPGSEQVELKFSWRGIQVCAYGDGQNANFSNVTRSAPEGTAMLEWQCTELVKRFLYLAYGAPPISNAGGDQIVDRYEEEYPDMFEKVDNPNNGTTQRWPKAGDVVSYSTVHTAIISNVAITDAANGDATLTIIEQNAANSGSTSAVMDNWVIQGGVDDPTGSGADTITEWLTPRWANNSPSANTEHILYGTAATSTSNVWAVGYDQPSGSSQKPVTYLYNGSSWTKYSPTLPGSGHHDLFGVEAISSSDAWAVGSYVNSTRKTMAFHWTGSSWGSKVTSADPSTGTNPANEFYDVEYDGTDTWAVGMYRTNQVPQPMIQKWNGSNAFTDQSPLLPPGATGGQLYGVDFSSSTNGWAVGQDESGSKDRYLVYRYDGSSWAGITGSTGPAALTSIYAVSDTEAWAVGSSGSGALVMHYTSGGGWQQDVTATNSAWMPTNATLKGVSGDGASNIWIVGYKGAQPMAWHYDGTDWTKANPPYEGTASAGSSLRGVTVISGDAWAVGASRSGSLNWPLTYLWD